MFKHILVPVDGSPTAQLAVGKAIGLARAFGSRVTAIFVIDPYPFTGVGADFAYGQAQYLTAAHAEAQATLKLTSDALAQSGVPFDTSVVESHAPWWAWCKRQRLCRRI
jgi:nucleotide-binding universal stress UspA family protein